ncbi:hypothetical protein [Rhodoferax sp. UBA5149]|uniref:hypothetical protein n=1 Tax=Rhodoferax sp. UBA5149 TaxID=1947379 RepID=UPI0025EF5719|nr:hypothetical protein [Rhodoferax sp. UBA5149]
MLPPVAAKKTPLEASFLGLMVSINLSMNQSAENAWVAGPMKIACSDFHMAACRGFQQTLQTSQRQAAQKTTFDDWG